MCQRRQSKGDSAGAFFFFRACTRESRCTGSSVGGGFAAASFPPPQPSPKSFRFLIRGERPRTLAHFSDEGFPQKLFVQCGSVPPKAGRRARTVSLAVRSG